MSEDRIFCKSGGCTSKLGPGALHYVLDKIPKTPDKNLLVGYGGADDASVYKLTKDLAIVQTLDFFPPMVEDPYLFGQIAAANALSDVYAMGGEVKTALNIVCFPEKMDLNLLGAILRGGADKVAEAGGVLSGGHSITDTDIKYGLSVTGIVHPDKIFQNSTVQPGDRLILTKPLGVGIVSTADRIGEASKEAMDQAVLSMTTLNKYAAEIFKNHEIHACTDVTGFGFLGHLYEMLRKDHAALIDHEAIPFIPEAFAYAGEFYLTAAAQRNRNFLCDKVRFQKGVPFAMEEILFDPQTSGGLLAAVAPLAVPSVLKELSKLGLPHAMVGEIVGNRENRIVVQ